MIYFTKVVNIWLLLQHKPFIATYTTTWYNFLVTQTSIGFTAEEIYNTLMFDIEPDLVTSVVPHLDEIYMNETSEEHAARSERYKRAFAEYGRRHDMFTALWNEEVEDYRDTVLQAMRIQNAGIDGALLSSVEEAMQSSTDRP